MGAFFLSHKTATIDESSIEEVYLRKGFKKPYVFQLGEYKLQLFKKQLLDLSNYCQAGENYIFACGSLFYKGLNYQHSLEQLLSDFFSKSIDPQQLYGNYVIIFYNGINKEIRFCIDPVFIKNVYFDSTKKILTTDFLALVKSSHDPYTLNRLAIIENLTTGHLISPDTYASEIQKLDRENFNSIESAFPGIKVQTFIPTLCEVIDHFDDALIHASNQLSSYFKSVGSLADEFGAHLGLTGGFDSRLLLMHARKHLKKLVTNSFWRKNSIEYKNAKELAKIAGVDFFSFEERPFVKPTRNEMIKASFYFFDGQVRSQNNWDEEFNLTGYSSQIASNHFVGFHGCGGEQYRNADRLMGKTRLSKFIRFEWMFKQCENVFIDRKTQSDIFENIERKIRRLVNIRGKKIGLFELKRIQNEIWNTANRSTRVNVLNQQQFCFAPFTEYQLSRSAYDYIPFLGKSISFQVEMMKRFDPELSQVMTNYGFNLLDGESLRYKLIPYVVNLFPGFVTNLLYFKMKHIQSNRFEISKFLENAHPFILSLGKNIDLSKLSRNNNLGNSLYSFNYLLKHLNLRTTV